jgi:fructoselysine-6-P-deglycase FrlB-like protein
MLNLLLLEILHHSGKKVSHLVSKFESIHEEITALTQSPKLINWAKDQADQLKSHTAGIYVLGDAIRYGIARKAALIMFMEGCKQDASPLRTEEFSHSLIETLEPDNRDKYTLMLLKPHKSFVSSQMNKQISFINKMWRRFSKNRVVKLYPYSFMKDYEKGEIGNLLSPTFYTIQIEWLAYYLALARKVDPGVSHLVKKVRKSRQRVP